MEKNPSKHRGSAFVKFKNPSVAKKLIKMSEGVKASPEERVLIDPKNVLEINNRPISVLSVLPKEEIEDNQKIKKEKLNKKKLKLGDLILLDRKRKRNFYLALEGLAVTEENVDAGKEIETQKRTRHLVV